MKTYGIDVNALTREKRTGTERYVFELIKKMKELSLEEDERVVLYASADIPELLPLPKNWELRILVFPKWMKGWTHIRLSLELLLHAPTIFFTPAHEVPLVTGGAKVVTTIHDLAFIHVPAVYTFKERMRQNWALKRALKKSHRIIAISEVTKQDINAYDRKVTQKTEVIYLGVGQVVSDASKISLPEKYIAYTGRLEEKKGTDILVSTFERLKDLGYSYDLVLVGALGSRSQKIEEMINNSFWRESIHLLGFVSEADRIRIVTNGSLFVFPSRFEGFGMPILEAMQLHVPVLASDLPVLQEIGGNAAIYFEQDSVDACLLEIKQILDDKSLQEKMITAGEHRIRKFSWEEAAKKTMELLRSV